MKTEYAKYLEVCEIVGMRGGFDTGQGSIGNAYRCGRNNDRRRPGWIVSRSFCAAAWQVGRRHRIADASRGIQRTDD